MNRAASKLVESALATARKKLSEALSTAYYFSPDNTTCLEVAQQPYGPELFVHGVGESGEDDDGAVANIQANMDWIRHTLAEKGINYPEIEVDFDDGGALSVSAADDNEFGDWVRSTGKSGIFTFQVQ